MCVSSVIQGFIVISALLWGGIRSLWRGSLSDFYGPCKLLLVVDGLFVVLSLFMSLIGNIFVLILFRLEVGMAIGAAGAVVQ